MEKRWKILDYIPGDLLPRGTQCRFKDRNLHSDKWDEWYDSEDEPLTGNVSDLWEFRVPDDSQPRDTCLTWLSNKIDEAARKHPDKAESLRHDWFAAKSRLADEMLAKIGGLS